MGNTESTQYENNEDINNLKKSSTYSVKLDIPDIRDYEFTLPENQIIEIDKEYSINIGKDIKNTGNCICDIINYVLYYEICQNEKALLKFYPSSDYLLNLINLNENNIDNESSIKNILKLINKYGIIPDTINSINNLYMMKVTNYFKIKYEKVTKNINNIKNLLLDNRLVIFNFTVYSSIDNKLSKKNKIIASPKAKDSVYGCYGAIIYGYNDTESKFKIILPLNNHWDNVYGYMSFDTFKLIANDIWILELNIKKDYSKLFEMIELNNDNKGENCLKKNEEIKTSNRRFMLL